MAHATHIATSADNGLAARFSTLVETIRLRAAKRKVFRQTFGELSSLSDRELSDLGLNRSEIRRIAWQAANEI